MGDSYRKTNNILESINAFKSAADCEVDGVIQHPGKHYTFDGGTSFVFTAPPEADSTVSVFFLCPHGIDITSLVW